MRKVSSFHYHLYRSTLGPDTQKVPDKKNIVYCFIRKHLLLVTKYNLGNSLIINKQRIESLTSVVMQKPMLHGWTELNWARALNHIGWCKLQCDAPGAIE